jgi:hypothetical protein
LMAVCTKQGVTGKWLNAVITAMRGRPQPPRRRRA